LDWRNEIKGGVGSLKFDGRGGINLREKNRPVRSIIEGAGVLGTYMVQGGGGGNVTRNRKKNLTAGKNSARDVAMGEKKHLSQSTVKGGRRGLLNGAMGRSEWLPNQGLYNRKNLVAGGGLENFYKWARDDNGGSKKGGGGGIIKRQIAAVILLKKGQKGVGGAITLILCSR